MSDITLTTRANGLYIDETWYNDLRSAISEDIIPRDADGVVGDIAGSIGDSTRAFLKAFIASGHFMAGDVKLHHSYNGAAPPGEGWMLCDGRQVTQSAYDTEHGSGHWVTYVGTSPLLNKYLPDMTGKYPVGKATTPQTGAGAITSVGNAGSTINIAHTHTHSHTHDTVVADNGFGVTGAPGSGHASGAPGTFTSGGPSAGSTNSQLSATQDVRPESIEVQYYMRVI